MQKQAFCDETTKFPLWVSVTSQLPPALSGGFHLQQTNKSIKLILIKTT